MGKYINPRTDYGFKYIFGRAEILMDLINVILKGEPGFEPVTKIEFNDKEMKRMRPYQRGVVYDLLCTTNRGHKFIVEMQKGEQSYFIDRSVFYVAKSITEQGKIGPEWKFEYKPVFIISLLEFTLPVLGTELRTDAMLCSLSTHQPISDKQRFIYIQFPNLKHEDWKDCESEFELLVYLLKNLETMDSIPFATPGSIFDKIDSVASYASLSQDERHEYDMNLQAYRDYVNSIDFAQKKGEALGMKKGEALGMKKGEALGMKKGEALGMKKGEELGVEKAKRDIVLSIHKNGIDAHAISTMTGIALSEVLIILNE